MPSTIDKTSMKRHSVENYLISRGCIFLRGLSESGELPRILCLILSNPEFEIFL